MNSHPHKVLEELTKELEIHKARILEIEEEISIQKKLDKEKEKLINLLWSGPKKNSRASKIMRIAILQEVGVWDTENSIKKHEEYFSKIDINCIDDLKKITWSDWRKRRIMRHKPGSYNRDINRTKKYGNCRPGKESWKMLQDCIKRARYYK